eukprot:TRINITY_DN7108_c0_g2_i1.p1 TRINITY_DN7108_c0_g2~~TRINITY_DN7108_c0_g2_i1.p1  ORF type:complete len:1404 (+),score=410.65 TRINITY_DN7108_c0_g2_i1:58-4269(+)
MSQACVVSLEYDGYTALTEARGFAALQAEAEATFQGIGRGCTFTYALDTGEERSVADDESLKAFVAENTNFRVLQSDGFPRLHAVATMPSRLPHVVTVTVVSASGLEDKDTFGGDSDPYAILEVPGCDQKKTPMVDGTSEPEWNFDAKYDVTKIPGHGPEKTLMVKVTVMDDDGKALSDDFLGETFLNLTPELLQRSIDAPESMTQKLADKKGKDAGSITFKVAATAQPAPAAPVPQEPVKKKRDQQRDQQKKRSLNAATPGVSGAAAASPATPAAGKQERVPVGVTVTVVSATGLADEDTFGKSDPYAVLELEGFPDEQTETKDNTQDPTWDKEVYYSLSSIPSYSPASTMALKITVYDADPNGRDLLGMGTLSLTPELLLRSGGGGGRQQEVKLDKKGVVKCIVKTKFAAADSAGKATKGAAAAAAEIGAVEVTVLGAKGLQDKDRIGKSDPYCVLEMDGKKTLQTKVIDGTSEPIWDYKATYDIPKAQSRSSLTLKLKVLDSDPVGSDFLGSCEVLLQPDVMRRSINNPEKLTVQLRDENGRTGVGSVQLAVEAFKREAVPAAGKKQEAVDTAPPPGFVCPDLLEVTVIRAIDLVDADGIGESDPYVEVAFPGRDVVKSTAIDGTLRPTWDYQCSTELKGNPNLVVPITVFDKDPMSSDFLGYTELRVTPTLLHKALEAPQKLAFHLTGRPGEADDKKWVEQHGGVNQQGKIFLKVAALNNLKAELPAPDPGAEKGPHPDVLNMVIVKATGLKSADTLGQSDPYVVVTATGHDPQQTPVVEGSLNPVWNHPMAYDLPPAGKAPPEFTLTVYDSDAVGKDLLGTGALRLTEAHLLGYVNKKQTVTVPLTLKGATAGRLFVSLLALATGGEAGDGPVKGPCPAMMEIVLQRATGLEDRDGFGTSDPFVKVAVPGHPDQQTPVQDGTQDPEWNHPLRYDLQGKDDHVVNFTVLDSDPVGADFLGHATVHVTPLMLRKALKKPQPICLKLGAPKKEDCDDAKWAKGKTLGKLFACVSAMGRAGVPEQAGNTRKGKSRWLYINVAKATGLVDRDMIGANDCVVEISVEGKRPKRTSVSPGTDPEWNEEIAIDVHNDDWVHCTVFDEDPSGEDFLGHASFRVADQFFTTESTKLSLNLGARQGVKDDGKFAKKHKDKLGQLHLEVKPPKKEPPTEPPVPTKKQPKTPTVPPAPKKAAKRMDSEEDEDAPPPPPAKTPAKTKAKSSKKSAAKGDTSDSRRAKRPLTAEEREAELEAEALRQLLEISPMARSRAAVYVGKEWKHWSWQQRLVVARQVEVGMLPEDTDASLAGPFRAAYHQRLSPTKRTAEEALLEDRFSSLWGVGARPRPAMSSRIDQIVAQRQQQALQDLDSELRLREELDMRAASGRTPPPHATFPPSSLRWRSAW